MTESLSLKIVLNQKSTDPNTFLRYALDKDAILGTLGPMSDTLRRFWPTCLASRQYLTVGKSFWGDSFFSLYVIFILDCDPGRNQLEGPPSYSVYYYYYCFIYLFFPVLAHYMHYTRRS
jgi:hypothetical protein